MALSEDLLGDLESELPPHQCHAADVTTHQLISEAQSGCAALVARSQGVVAGLPIARLVLDHLGWAGIYHWNVRDGDRVEAGDKLAHFRGQAAVLLTAERTLLNFVQRLSGIATLTARFIGAIQGMPVLICDTRKTTPGWRALEKYAVRCGGGHNHRSGLFDGILVKDNHLAVLDGAEDFTGIVGRLRRQVPNVPIQIEVDSLDQVRLALRAQPDALLLDNMPAELLRQAVSLRNQIAPQVVLEASGGITLDTIREVAASGVDRISIGALTHSAPALDIALDWLGHDR